MAQKPDIDIDELKAKVALQNLERRKEVLERRRGAPALLQARIEKDLLPRFAPQRACFLERLEGLRPQVESMPLEEVPELPYRGKDPVYWVEFTKLETEVREACLPYLRKDELVDGAFYRITCRNANVGVWRKDQQGFEIPREKFGSHYLFVEYHWDNGPPFGTSRPWERLEDLPPEALGDEGCLLRFMMWRNAEVRFQEHLRRHVGVSAWEPLPEEGSPAWVAGMEKLREERRQHQGWYR